MSEIQRTSSPFYQNAAEKEFGNIPSPNASACSDQSQSYSLDLIFLKLQEWRENARRKISAIINVVVKEGRSTS